MPKRPLIIATVLSVLVVFGFAMLGLWRTSAELDQARAALSESKSAADQQAAKAEEFKRKLTESQARIEELLKEKENSGQTQQNLEQEMRAALESKDVTISQLQGRLTVNILDHVMFDSGEAALKTDGGAVLSKVAKLLAQHPELKIHVIGHTDNVPIRTSARSRFPSNWELSTARATAAVRHLIEKEGVDPRRVGALGYGEFRPVADNATPEGRARNRRIAITVLPEDQAAPAAPSTPPAPLAPGQPLPAALAPAEVAPETNRPPGP